MDHKYSFLFLLLVLGGFVPGIQAQTTELSNDINNLSFDNIFGGPLQAAVNAQVNAAKTTLDYVDDLAFITYPNGTQTIRMVDFAFSSDVNGTRKTTELHVPFILMAPIPYLRVADLSVEFNARLTSVDIEQTTSSSSCNNTVGLRRSVRSSSKNTKRDDSSSDVSSGCDQSILSPDNRVSMSGTVVNQSKKKETASTRETQQDFSMNVKMKVRQAETPKGLERILDLFETLIKAGPVI